MPTYDYVCDACGHEFELFQSILADPEKKCPQCKKNKLRRLMGTGAAVVFKGSGFYQTDYRSDSYKKSAAADKKTTDGTSGGSESKSESKTDSVKTETKAEPKPTPKSEAPKTDVKPSKKPKSD